MTIKIDVFQFRLPCVVRVAAVGAFVESDKACMLILRLIEIRTTLSSDPFGLYHNKIGEWLL
jgi:hypothetical protein